MDHGYKLLSLHSVAHGSTVHHHQSSQFHEPASTPSRYVHSRPFLVCRPHSCSKVRPATAHPHGHPPWGEPPRTAWPPVLSIVSRHSLTLFLDLPASVEVWDQPHSCCMAAAFKPASARNEEIGANEDRFTISGDCRPPEIDNDHAEMQQQAKRPSCSSLKTPSVISPESREEAKPEPVTAESPRCVHRFSFAASAQAAACTPNPSAREATPSEGAPCPGHPIMVMLLTSNSITQSPRRLRMHHSGYGTHWTSSLSSIERWCPRSRPCSSPWAASYYSLASPHMPAVQYSRILA